jgi:DNA processing protein
MSVIFSVPRAYLKAWYQALESWVEVLHAPAHVLQRITPTASREINIFLRYRHRTNVNDTLRRCHELDLNLIVYGTTDYPLLLEHIPDAPIVLYALGELPILPPIAIVGSRESTAYGEHVARDLCAHLISHHYPIISGLAQGIDTAVHQATHANDGISIGVLPCGHDYATRGKMSVLMRSIQEHHGCLLSEYPPGVPAKPHRFLERNRIIAGMAQATIVAEAGKLPSGSIHTAHTALGYHRDVWATPGSIFLPSTRGCHYLIENGVPALWDFSKIHEHLQYKPLQERPVHIEEAIPTPTLSSQLAPLEQRLILTVAQGPLSTYAIAKDLQQTEEHIGQLLVSLEVDGFVENKYGLWYSGARYASAHR